MGDGGEPVVFACPVCRQRIEIRGPYRREIVVACPRCGTDATKAFKLAFFRGVAAEMNATIVERENRDFLRNLKQAFVEGRRPDSPPEEDRPEEAPPKEEPPEEPPEEDPPKG